MHESPAGFDHRMTFQSVLIALEYLSQLAVVCSFLSGVVRVFANDGEESHAIDRDGLVRGLSI